MPFPSNMLFPKLSQLLFTNLSVLHSESCYGECKRDFLLVEGEFMGMLSLIDDKVQQNKIVPFSKFLLMQLLRQTFLVLNFISFPFI